MEITIENYIDYCSSMDIATESFSSIKAALISGFSKLILWIESKVKKMKDNKVKSVLIRLLNRAKTGLSKSKSLNENNPELVKKLQEELNDIKEESNKVDSEEEPITNEFKNACAKKSKLMVRIMLKDSTLTLRNKQDLLTKYVSYASSQIKDLWDEDDGEEYETYNELAVAIVNNFSKKKWNKLVKLGKEK